MKCITRMICIIGVSFLIANPVISSAVAASQESSCYEDGTCGFKSCDIKQIKQQKSNSKSDAMPQPKIVTANTITWQPYSQDVLKQAKSTHHMILVLSKSDECYWSRKLEEATLSDPQVVNEINKSFMPVALIFDESNDASKKYKITSLPTMMVLDVDGNKMLEIKGFIPPSEFLEKLSTLPHRNP